MNINKALAKRNKATKDEIRYEKVQYDAAIVVTINKIRLEFTLKYNQAILAA